MSNITEIIICTCAIILTIGVCFFLMAIWRAIRGKSTIDFKLNVAVSTLNKGLKGYSTVVEASSRTTEKSMEKLRREILSLSKKLENDGKRD